MEKNKLFSQVALEYRLSLNNLCKLYGFKQDDENRKKVYDLILDLYKKDQDATEMYKYLFNYETLSESDEIEQKSYKRALIFLSEYKKNRDKNNPQALKITLNRLSKTQNEFRTVKITDDVISKETAEKIARFRIKYCISTNAMAKHLGIARSKLVLGESKITDEYLKSKLGRLNEYYVNKTGIYYYGGHNKNKEENIVIPVELYKYK